MNAIQKNKYALKAVTLRGFNVLNVDTYRLLDHPAKLAVLGELGVDPVPQLGTLVLNHTVDELVAFSEGVSVLNPQGPGGGRRVAPARRGVR